MDKATLKECPFCGEEATWSDKTPVKWINRGAVPYQLGCSDGKCPVKPYGSVYKTEQDAIAAWNTRPIEDKLKRDNKALLELLKKTIALARRTCWIAYVWNDHNFAAAHEEARSQCKRLGITSFDSANEYLKEIDSAIEKAEDEQAKEASNDR